MTAYIADQPTAFTTGVLHSGVSAPPCAGLYKLLLGAVSARVVVVKVPQGTALGADRAGRLRTINVVSRAPLAEAGAFTGMKPRMRKSCGPQRAAVLSVRAERLGRTRALHSRGSLGPSPRVCKHHVKCACRL